MSLSTTRTALTDLTDNNIERLVGETVTSAFIDTDVCIIGAGPAGLIAASECANAPFRVALVEGGSFEHDERSQVLAAATTRSRHFREDAIESGRARQFGGTSNIWSHFIRPGDGGRYARSLPGEALDFAMKDWQEQSGWPVSLEELSPFYSRSQRLFNGGPFDYSPARWSDDRARPLDLGSSVLQTRMCQHGASEVFRQTCRDRLIAAENVSVHVGCTVVELETEAGEKSVKSARIVRLDGSVLRLRAKLFVLAGGGVENVQSLLLSPATRPGEAGNRFDNIGRFVTDHPEFMAGTILPRDPDLFDELALYDMRFVNDIMVSGMFTLNEDVKVRENLLNMSVVVVPQPRGFGSKAERSLRTLYAVARRQGFDNPVPHMGTLLGSPRDTVAVLRRRLQGDSLRDTDFSGGYVCYQGGWSRAEVDKRDFRVLEVHAATEQTPERENKMTLGRTRDWLGRQQIVFDWRWASTDHKNVTRSLDIIGADLARAGLGQFRKWIDFEGIGRPVRQGLHHPMGGTRMHHDARHGVVDANCKVHGLANLYVAGSSVFPTGLGYANPTLTLMALSVRLADHLKLLLGATAATPGKQEEVRTERLLPEASGDASKSLGQVPSRTSV